MNKDQREKIKKAKEQELCRVYRLWKMEGCEAIDVVYAVAKFLGE